jgi:dienelactone hydrolase
MCSHIYRWPGCSTYETISEQNRVEFSLAQAAEAAAYRPAHNCPQPLSFARKALGTDKPDSPHLFVKNITGRVYVAGAIEDASFPEEQKIRLEEGLTDAGMNHVVETYAGARHGFAVPDLPVFDKGAA